MKLARRATGRGDIIAFVGGLPRTDVRCLSLTSSKAAYRRGMGPLLPGIHHIRYPYCFRYCTHSADDVCELVERELQLLFATTTAPETVAAIVVEPVQGEGGYVVPPATFLPMLRRVCDEHGIMLVADEVQTGFGRTGKMFAVEHAMVEPDIMCLAKALGNGMPIAAMVAGHRVMSAFHEGEHGTTYGGNAVACAAAVAVIETMTRDRIPERSERLGRRVMERARGWQADMPALADVRGLGLMIGLEFVEAGAPATKMVDAHFGQRPRPRPSAALLWYRWERDPVDSAAHHPRIRAGRRAWTSSRLPCARRPPHDRGRRRRRGREPHQRRVPNGHLRARRSSHATRANGDVVGVFSRSDAADVEAAVAAARTAFDGWRRTPWPSRAAIILRASELLEERKESLAQLMTREMGKVLTEARGDVQEAIDMGKFIAGEGRRAFGETVPSELRDKWAMTMRQPFGVVGCITPWNFPIAIPSGRSSRRSWRATPWCSSPPRTHRSCALRSSNRSRRRGFPPAW